MSNFQQTTIMVTTIVCYYIELTYVDIQTQLSVRNTTFETLIILFLLLYHCFYHHFLTLQGQSVTLTMIMFKVILIELSVALYMVCNAAQQVRNNGHKLKMQLSRLLIHSCHCKYLDFIIHFNLD